MPLSRRSFFTLAGASAATVMLADPLKKLYARAAAGKSVTGKGYGELLKDTKGIFDLPPGFQYHTFSQTGEIMSDGTPVPQKHDGMVAFPGENGKIILIRNHEVSPELPGGVVAPEENKYDKLGKGGTTTLIVNSDRQLVKHYVSLAGTSRNCAGGATPWKSWITCEEHTATPAQNQPNSPKNVSMKHGYNFEVPSKGELVTPVALKAMGRFNHEAIAVDPTTGYIYQTEDRDDSCIYRFRPKETENLAAGGILEALVIKGSPTINTSINFPMSEPKEVEWETIENVDPEEDNLRYEAQKKGAAIFKRGEGACYGNGEIYWTCTSGGKAEIGQIFRYAPQANTVELFVESPNRGVLDYPDNLTFAPNGHLFVCEDGLDEQFLVGITPEGECYPFARNALNKSELAGICFAPDGKTMFVNIQNPGITLAIWGEW
ncbi:MAG: DUF839 domain-containing protein [Gomphosphaeria aponina SAG 52.96 = DSM 107014]|uniref:DUF839 domain-containing protein n=1 Tax=Gomphosphaeria aponina SAG 52.96 = DSM 107014 TaxID=1521640 RepID=A0A941GXB0_9CHRO|nr:DUF839 domain-containing protein [Gomphosphaeria aponina SAG 52.96 = DSM 107014]